MDPQDVDTLKAAQQRVADARREYENAVGLMGSLIAPGVKAIIQSVSTSFNLGDLHEGGVEPPNVRIWFGGRPGHGGESIVSGPEAIFYPTIGQKIGIRYTQEWGETGTSHSMKAGSIPLFSTNNPKSELTQWIIEFAAGAEEAYFRSLHRPGSV